jgi:hypothetical protein
MNATTMAHDSKAKANCGHVFSASEMQMARIKKGE